MAKVRSKGSTYSPSVRRVSPLKPGLTGARNWATAQMRTATYSKEGFWRLALSMLFMFFVIIFGALWLGGFLPDARQTSQDFTRSRLIAMGFVVDRVDVVGEGRLREVDVRVALGVNRGDFLFGMDMQAAQDRVEALNWVEQAIVRRLWPDKIVVQIIERRPYALWQHDGEVKLVDADGKLIADTDVLQFANLPLVVGANAAETMTEIHAHLAAYPHIAARVSAIIQMPSGRWDVRLDDGKLQIKLPQDNPKGALARLASLQGQKQILDRNIAIIDLRLPDRLTLSPRYTEPA